MGTDNHSDHGETNAFKQSAQLSNYSTIALTNQFKNQHDFWMVAKSSCENINLAKY
jgi:hypothetical protein